MSQKLLFLASSPFKEFHVIFFSSLYLFLMYLRNREVFPIGQIIYVSVMQKISENKKHIWMSKSNIPT